MRRDTLSLEIIGQADVKNYVYTLRGMICLNVCDQL